MTWLFSLLGGLPGIITTIFGYLGKVSDTVLEKFRIGNNNAKEVSVTAITADTQKSIAMMDLQKSAMNHPIWWFAWALYVLPAGFHNAAVHFVSTFHLAYIVDKLPPDFIAQDKVIVMSIFGAQVGTGIIDKVVNAWVSKRA